MRTSIGVVRKTDSLGRVVIPKEIRKRMGIMDGDPLEMFIEIEENAEGGEVAGISLRKFSYSMEHKIKSDIQKIIRDVREESRGYKGEHFEEVLRLLCEAEKMLD